MENENKSEYAKVGMVINAVIVIAVIFAFVNLQIVWPLYYVIGVLSFIMFMQTTAAAVIFSRLITTIPSRRAYTKEDYGIAVIVTLIYFVSCYVLYIAGFTYFALIAVPHVVIMFLTNLIGAISK